MNKFDRVMTILMLLQTKHIVKAQELANKFEVSIRTIYRDLKTLENAGVPIHAEAGVGYSIVAGYNLPPVMFTEEEAASFLIAEKLVEKMTDNSTSELFSNAISKIKAVLRSKEKEKINNLENHILITPQSVLDTKFKNVSMSKIFNSIDQNSILEISYFANYSNENTLRRIEPLGIQFYANNWHLIAFCQLRQDYRDFRIDRIKNLKITTEHFDTNHPDLDEYLTKIATKQNLITVTVVFNDTVANFTKTERYFHGFISEKHINAGVEMEFLCSSLIGMGHWLLLFVDKIDIVKPIELKTIMADLTKKLVEKYS